MPAAPRRQLPRNRRGRALHQSVFSCQAFAALRRQLVNFARDCFPTSPSSVLSNPAHEPEQAGYNAPLLHEQR